MARWVIGDVVEQHRGPVDLVLCQLGNAADLEVPVRPAHRFQLAEVLDRVDETSDVIESHTILQAMSQRDTLATLCPLPRRRSRRPASRPKAMCRKATNRLPPATAPLM